MLLNREKTNRTSGFQAGTQDEKDLRYLKTSFIKMKGKRQSPTWRFIAGEVFQYQADCPLSYDRGLFLREATGRGPCLHKILAAAVTT